jgi:hypothetical protein
MRDWIISGRTGEIYAEIDFIKNEAIDYFHSGKIVSYLIPNELAELIDEYDELVSGCVLTLLDEVEEKIYQYDLRLKLLGIKIFGVSIKEKNMIEFFTKYPTGKGFLDDYPN